MSREAITGVVLAGGRGSRFGGADKGWIDIAGRALIAHVLERFAPQVDAILISANRNQGRYAALGYPVFSDASSGFVGPLAGLYTGLAHAAHGLVATVPCDCPALPRDLVSRLHAALIAEQATVAVAKADGRVQPVFCLCRIGVVAHVQACLRDGERRMGAWYAALPHVEVDFDDQVDAFRNINTPDDLAAFASTAG